MGSVASRPDDRLPAALVARWLAEQGVHLALPVRAELIAGGRSNLTYALIGADDNRVVVRRPPFEGVLQTAHDVSREWRFIQALGATGVPVADPLALAETPALLGVPFYVMSYVDGIVPHDAWAAEALSFEARTVATASLIDTMAILHQIDIDEVDLGGIARQDDYIGRQLRRWKQQWSQSICTDITAVDVAHDRLRATVPPQIRTSVVHGDFRLGNMICAPDGRIRAVLDWELATLGDPLADLGWLVSSWVETGEWSDPSTVGAPPSILPGFPPRQWLIDRYADRSGADVSGLDFYVAFAHWRSACISAGVLTRYESGVMGDDGFDPGNLRTAIAAKADAVLELLDR